MKLLLQVFAGVWLFLLAVSLWGVAIYGICQETYAESGASGVAGVCGLFVGVVLTMVCIWLVLGQQE